MKPFYHSKTSVKKFGGTVEDYQPIHDWFDQTKQCLPDVRHRALLHSAWGVFLAEQVFGSYIRNSDGKDVPVRQLAEDHVIQDMGFIPTVEWWFKNLPIEDRMMGKAAEKRMKQKKIFRIV